MKTRTPERQRSSRTPSLATLLRRTRILEAFADDEGKPALALAAKHTGDDLAMVIEQDVRPASTQP